MQKERMRIIVFLSFLFCLLCGFVYTITESQKNKEINTELLSKLENLQTHYNILLHNQSVLADAAYTATLTDEAFMHLFRQIKDASAKRKDELRKELYKLLEDRYATLIMQGVLQFHFILPNNESFLRMHKPSIYGDDLSSTRKDIVLTNTYRVPFKAFAQGRCSHGFRNTYPIFAPESSYLGVMEISFSSDSFQKHMENISHIHTHFLLPKDIFKEESFKNHELILPYEQSIEHKDFIVTKNLNAKYNDSVHNAIEELSALKKQIDKGLKNKKSFSVYIPLENDITIVGSYFPIYDIDKKEALAWLVSYEKSPFISKNITTTNYIRFTFFVIFLILALLLYKLALTNFTRTKEYKLVNDILNATDDILFITDFHTVTFFNRKFQECFTTYTNISDMFLIHEGYLHKQLLHKDENFAELINRTVKENQVVLILNRFHEKKSFNISISKMSSSLQNSYLVTLTDITQIKEKESQIKQKIYLDGLTGIYNRTKFDEVLYDEIKRAMRYHSTFSLVILDIDYFKKFNDKYGHLIGDEVLITLTEAITLHLRSSDTFARWGGEEFVILLPNTAKTETLDICEKLRRIIESTPHLVAGNITASFGVTQYQEGDRVQSIFERCDTALYMAKVQGRNRVLYK